MQNFVLMGASFLAFGVSSVDLFLLVTANLELFAKYGLMVIEDGALTQLVQLLALACVSGLCYLVFVLCDRTLLRRLTERLESRHRE